MQLRWACFSLLLLLVPSLLWAGILRVEQDGSGDYTAIQPALDAAAAGDTILIGPGVYTEYQTVTLPNWNWAIDVYAYVQQENLTIIGTDREAVVIGPEVADFHLFGPKGITVVQTVNALRVENVTLRNLYNGIYFYTGELRVQSFSTRGCGFGITVLSAISALVEECDFRDTDYAGVKIDGSSGEFDILDSYFFNCHPAVFIDSSDYASVRDCVIEGDGTIGGAIIGVKFDSNARGEILRCEFRSLFTSSIVVSWGSTAVITDNYCEQTQANLEVNSYSHAQCEGNQFLGGSFATLIIGSQSTLFAHNNHILNNGGPSVLVQDYFNPPDVYFHMSNNYWGTSDAAQIAEWIQDGHDDSSVHAFVLYEPFHDGPVGTEQQTWGGVKNLYR
jgi:hypothetical protein